MSQNNRSTQDEWITRVLGCTFPTPANPPGQRIGVRLTQALMLWNQTRSHVGQQVSALQRAILAASSEDEDYPEIVAGIDNLETVLSLVDDDLLDVLSAVRATKDEGEKAKLLDRANAIVRRCQKEANESALLADIDDKNGFMPLDIKTRMTSTFTEVLELLKT